jgi:glycosyltransferase involved in cell wall biosynthesis
MTPERGRLGIYVDAVYRPVETTDRRRVTTDRAFLLFACEVGSRFDRLLLFGRALEGSNPADYELPVGVELVELPHYTNLLRLGQVARALPGTLRAMWRGLARVDLIWVIGPNPFDVVLIALALLRRKRIALGVRQDTVAYYRSRVPSRLWAPAVAAMWGVDLVYRLLARRARTTVVGAEIARRYGGGPTVLPMTVTLMRASAVATQAPEKDWSGPIELLTVGRLEPEKNPLLLVEALAELDRHEPGRYRLTWIGRGPLEDDVRRRARELRVTELIDLRGYVPFGPELFARYRAAHVFVHVSLTEGVPQVIVEALACGTLVVATGVGGVPAAFGDPQAALLVPPRDVGALTAAIRRLVSDGELRDGYARRGLELARHLTLEAEAGRVARFLAGDELPLGSALA